MKQIWKKALALGMSLVMVFSLTAVAAEPEAAPTDTEQAPAGISVVLDGQALSFTDVQPQMKDNRTFVPFRSVFEAMGATVEFDNATRVVSAERDGILVEFTLGSADVKVTENGQTETFQADVVPYVDAASGRTLIPVRFAAQALGSLVGWNQPTQTVNIIDTAKLEEAYGDKFQLMDRYAQDSAGRFDEKGVAFTGSIEMEIAINNEGEMVAMPITGDLSGSSNDQLANMDMTLSFDLDDLLASTGETLTEEDKAALELLENLEMSYIVNLETGMVYISCPALDTVLGTAEGTWYSMDLNAIYGEALGMDLNSLMAQAKELSVSDALIQAAALLMDEEDAYQLVTDMMDQCVAVIGDEAFHQDGDTYTSSFDVDQNGSAVSLDIVLEEVEGKLQDASVSLAVTGDGMEMSIVAVEKGEQSNVSMSFGVDGAMSLKLALDMTYSELTEEIQSAPPAGSNVQDLMELMETSETEPATEENAAA